MLKSMTGFGKREAAFQGNTVIVEIRSVNHRFREVALRLPKGFLELEEELKRLIGKHCSRGRFDITVTFSTLKEGRKLIGIDRHMARQYVLSLRELKRDFNLKGEVDIGIVANFRDIFYMGEAVVEDKKIQPLIKRLVVQALGDLETMRAQEGKVLYTDLIKRLKILKKNMEAIAQRATQVVEDYSHRLKGRIQHLLEGREVDTDRLTQEIALFADRCDVTEELTRFDSHIGQFQLLMQASEPVGRKLDFLLQEMGREVNTIGSKANDADISSSVVQIKSELEKVREQVQNIE